MEEYAICVANQKSLFKLKNRLNLKAVPFVKFEKGVNPESGPSGSLCVDADRD